MQWLSLSLQDTQPQWLQRGSTFQTASGHSISRSGGGGNPNIRSTVDAAVDAVDGVDTGVQTAFESAPWDGSRSYSCCAQLPANCAWQEALYGADAAAPDTLHVSYTCARLSGRDTTPDSNAHTDSCTCALALVLTAQHSGNSNQPPTSNTSTQPPEDEAQQVTLLLVAPGDTSAAGCECFTEFEQQSILQEAGTLAIEPDKVLVCSPACHHALVRCFACVAVCGCGLSCQ